MITADELKCPSGHDIFFVQKMNGKENYYWCNGCHKGYVKGAEKPDANAI